ncbi:phospholipase A1 isoform X1 [Tribolium castaneum]|uniref:Phospholipase A1 1-like Protein n=1 Tax=Tribolium castaneum TaxID=7070 RepID=A0A139WC44_TRICA|nr:PREDICTED: phospholipase A1-like isoform X1 [Tribolium castaneum]KYB25493.1 Phospholipase A1 1-like Protein [Tribolium castaneum]|eukprot:XP_015838835.1 PREDICTED: phospholipase A1-like isoform X1 [Tribolium castaneum]
MTIASLIIFYTLLLYQGKLTSQLVYTREFLSQIPSVDFCQADATKSDVFYYLFKSATQTTAITINEDYSLPEDERNLPMKILMHGYTSNVTSPWYKQMKQEYFQKGPHNIIYVDWSIASNKSFAVSAANIKPVGEFIADLIVSLRVPVENVHLIGHSLGSHLAGFVGKNIYSKTGKKVARITATDAAGPGFENAKPEARLNKHDATFIDVIHTDVNYYGILKPIGHVDFYVNGGKNQPGCPARKVDDNCSHARSNDYFIESINKRNVMARPAKLNDEEEIVLTSRTEDVEFGDWTPATARGIYFIKTNKTAPYLLQKKIKDT